MTDERYIRVFLPKEMESYRGDLEFFVSTMVRKLHSNRHKGDNRAPDPVVMLDRAKDELFEARDAITNEGQFAAAVEFIDAANFMFLGARGLWDMTREDFETMRKKIRGDVKNEPEAK